MDKIYKLAPNFFQNLMVSLYNFKAYQRRYGGKYHEFLKLFKENRILSREALIYLQKTRYAKFVKNAISNSKFYHESFKNVSDPINLDNIGELPILNKEILRSKIDEIVIQTDEKLTISKTGGTTGKSLEVKTRIINTQERFAMLDDFRSRLGYKLGKKTAWFSGKDLLTKRDINKNRFWKTDYWYKVRYYSTFHIKKEYLSFYIENLIRFKPEYLVGFPSTMLDIARYGLANNFQFPPNIVKAIFPTAETVTAEMRSDIEAFFHTKIYDQYASSEGAPFIIECDKGNLHLELQSGVFEVLDDQNIPAQEGKLVVTSFTTDATPLIRYDIGDSIILDDPRNICSCGNNNPMAKAILGRMDDYIYSPENGKINLGNISNTLKGTKGILGFQAVQNSLNSLDVLVVTDKSSFNKEVERIFIKNWRDRIGPEMKFEIHYVNDIKVEASGKSRIVKNNIKHLVDV